MYQQIRQSVQQLHQQHPNKIVVVEDPITGNYMIYKDNKYVTVSPKSRLETVFNQRDWDMQDMIVLP